MCKMHELVDFVLCLQQTLNLVHEPEYAHINQALGLIQVPLWC